MAFRILGIKILKECSPYIKKVLIEDETYLLTDDYTAGENPLLLKKIGKNDNIALTNLYELKDVSGHIVNINVSAIVGKNGDGKSTIVEVMLRLMNNFAY